MGTGPRTGGGVGVWESGGAKGQNGRIREGRRTGGRSVWLGGELPPVGPECLRVWVDIVVGVKDRREGTRKL